MTKITANFTIKEVLLVLCLNNNIAVNNPGEPPHKAMRNKVFSGTRLLFFRAWDLSYPAKIKTRTFINKKYSKKIFIYY